MADEKDYYQFVPNYNNYDVIYNPIEKEYNDENQVYKGIPSYNLGIKSLQDISKGYSSSAPSDDVYYNTAVDSNLIYNDGYPSYRMVNNTSPRVVDLSQKSIDSPEPKSSDRFQAFGSSRTEILNVSQIAKLTEAIKELTSRLPVPPSPELLKSVHPDLAVKLQLTYLKAYIQNQQLLMDLKSKIDGSFSTGELSKYSPTFTPQDQMTNGTNFANYPIVEFRSSYPQLTNQHITDHPEVNVQPSEPYNYNTFEASQNFPVSYPQLTNYPNFYYQPQNQQNYPKLTNYPQLTNYPHLAGRSGYQYGDPAFDKDYSGDFGKAVEDPASLVPLEYRDRVKYNPAKRSFVSVYLNSLGLRKRKSFSINKFGLNKALKLSINFSNKFTLNKASGTGSVGASDPGYGEAENENDDLKLALRERNLIEDVCEYALAISGGSVDNFELFEKASNMDRARGLVYSLGANVWMCIYYKKAKRKIQHFSVKEFGFEKCYKMGQKFFDNNPEVVRSKLSGPLSYWLESTPTKTLVIIFKVKSSVFLSISNSIDSIPQNNISHLSTTDTTSTNVSGRGDLDHLFIGRFEIDVYGSFFAAKKASQNWFKCINKGLYHTPEFKALTKSSFSKEGGTLVDKDLERLGFVYYDDFNKKWIVVNGPERVEFSVESLGSLEAKKQAINHRHLHLNPTK